MSTTDPNLDEWEQLRRESGAIFGLASPSMDEVAGHYAADLDDSESALLAKFSERRPLTKEEKEAAILLLRQNRTALEMLASLILEKAAADS